MIETIITIIIFLFSAVIHEVAHGWMANRLGDPTAKLSGRLTLNPIKHIDPLGSVILPLFLIIFNANFIFGWAKPVPINPFNLRKKYDNAKVAFAGPLSNISLALVFGILYRLLPYLGDNMFLINLSIIFATIVWVNLLLAIFNLVPIPPLDGSHILFAFLPRSMENIKVFLSQYGNILLIFFIFFLFRYLIPIIEILFNLVLGNTLH